MLLVLLGAGAGGWARAQNATATAPPANAGAPASVSANGNVTAPGDKPTSIPELHVGDKVYYDVKVFQVTPKEIVISHRGGLASIALTDLPPDLQAKFSYDPAKAAAAAAKEESVAAGRRLAGSGLGQTGFAAERILQKFGQPPKINQAVSLRPRFDQLGIDAKNQGMRPSCAVFAVVSALEYQQAPLKGPAPRLSEEYLIWATLKTLGKAGIRIPKVDTPGFDVGFSIPEVTQALRAYGISTEEELPYHLTAADARIVEPTPEVIDRAKLRSPVNGYIITGRDAPTRIGGIIHALNEGVPVVAGMRWPAEDTLTKEAVLDAQPGRDGANHAVLIVGYRSKAGKLDDVEFLFKNSYGDNWGDHGYGLVTYEYLVKNLDSAFFMDVR